VHLFRLFARNGTPRQPNKYLITYTLFVNSHPDYSGIVLTNSPIQAMIVAEFEVPSAYSFHGQELTDGILGFSVCLEN
jgi:hypothetical protein